MVEESALLLLDGRSMHIFCAAFVSVDDSFGISDSGLSLSAAAAAAGNWAAGKPCCAIITRPSAHSSAISSRRWFAHLRMANWSSLNQNETLVK